MDDDSRKTQHLPSPFYADPPSDDASRHGPPARTTAPVTEDRAGTGAPPAGPPRPEAASLPPDRAPAQPGAGPRLQGRGAVQSREGFAPRGLFPAEAAPAQSPAPARDGGEGEGGGWGGEEADCFDPDDPYPDGPDSGEPFPEDPAFGDPYPDDPFPGYPGEDGSRGSGPAGPPPVRDPGRGRRRAPARGGARAGAGEAPPAAAGGRCALVAVESAAPGLYSYLVPEGTEVRTGQAVLVPFGGRELVGYVMGTEPRWDGFRGALKPLRAVLREEPLFGEDFPALVEEMAAYYHYPAGLCVREILPGGLAPRIVREAALTGEGERAAEDPSLPETDPLAVLRKAAPAAVPLSAFRGEGAAARVVALARRGLVRILYSLSGRGSGFAYETVLTAVPVPPEAMPRLGRKERELWERLAGMPPTPVSHFRNYFKDAARLARGLEAKGLVSLERAEISRDDPGRVPDIPRGRVDRLTPEQEAALAAILAALDRASEGRPGGAGGEGGAPSPASPAGGRFLLFGVTGSGKTEVYLRAALRALSQGGGVLWLTPEIALTLGLEARIKASLPGTPLAVLHSGLSVGERHDHWMSLARGRARLALGARSAVFAPVRDLRLVIVDEEHDWAYKQEDGLRYHGRDVAAHRARRAGAVLILGSATPSLESYRAAEVGRLSLLVMRERPGEARLPQVRVVDRRKSARGTRILSPELRNEILAAFHRGEQALLFINRRGWASLPLCLSCGATLKCPSCSLNLTLHGPQGPVCEGADAEHVRGIPAGSVLICHGCGWRGRPPAACPDCGAGMVRYLGAGTERLLESAERDFKTRGMRLDADSARRKGGLKAALEGFGRGEASFLVGTQMAAKGHDFPNLTVVGVVDADVGLSLPDFRAAERTFQLLSQVAGRAGRAGKPGRVLIQTLNPDHYSIVSARSHDYPSFYASEAALRRELGLPPFGRLALLRFTGPDEARAEDASERAAGDLRALISERPGAGLSLLGPAPSPVGRLKERFRFQMMLRADTSAARGEILAAFAPLCRKTLPKSVALAVDVDPYHLM